jgi:chromosome segregation ATPase
MTLEQSFKALKAAFSSKAEESEIAVKQLAEANSKMANAVAETETIKAALAATSVERDGLIAKIAELESKIEATEQIKKQMETQIVSSGKAAASIAAAVGVQPVEVSPADAEASKSNEEIWNEYLAISDPAKKVAFYSKHRAAIVAHLGIR